MWRKGEINPVSYTHLVTSFKMEYSWDADDVLSCDIPDSSINANRHVFLVLQSGEITGEIGKHIALMSFTFATISRLEILDR